MNHILFVQSVGSLKSLTKANEARLTQLLKYHTVRGERRNVGRVIVCYSYI